MTYRRVIPRDLFNEADLLKCLGRLWIELDKLHPHTAVLDWARRVDEGLPFVIEQDPGSGGIEVVSLGLRVSGSPYRLTRPLNSRQPWPLYAEDDDDATAVFTEAGDLSPEFLALIGAATSQQQGDRDD